MQRPTSSSTALDSGYSLLGTTRRRYLLYQLLEDENRRIEELTRQIAIWEAAEVDEDVTEDARQRIYISLVHTHLPKLADHGVIDYDLRSGDVVIEDISELKPLLEQFKRTEDVTEIRRMAPV